MKGIKKMKCKGTFVFKELKKVEAGSFTNKETGEIISYKENYKLKVDEVSEQGINERVFKITIDNTNCLNGLNGVKPYDKINIDFDLELFASGCRLKPLAISPVK